VANLPREKFWTWYFAALVPMLGLVALALDDRMHPVSDFAISQGAPDDVLGFGGAQQIVFVALPCLAWLLLLSRAVLAAKSVRRVVLCVAQIVLVVGACATAISDYRSLERRVFQSA
jgi:hypothetical protein